MLAAAAPLAVTTAAEAALKVPTKVPPPRVRPLGVWKLVERIPLVEVGPVETLATIQLTFRSDIDVLDPYINVWPPRIPIPPLPAPVPPLPDAPRVATPIPVGSPHRPAERPFGIELVGGVIVPVTIEIPVASGTCTTTFRVTVQMSDGPSAVVTTGATRRRSTFSFMLRAIGSTCYTGRIPDPELPVTGRPVNIRPTSRPAATKTPRLPPFKTATPTRTPTPV